MSLFKTSQTVFGAKRLPQLISKHGNKNFYKGRGGKKFGRPNQYGKFEFNPKQFQRHTFRAPDLEGFTLKAYVARDTPKVTAAYVRSKVMEKIEAEGSSTGNHAEASVKE